MGKKEVKTNAMRILDRKKISYEYQTYECDEFTDGIETADKLNLPHEQVYKTIVTTGKSGEHYVFVLPIEAEIDFKIFKRAIINLLYNILQHNPAGINALVCLTNQKKIIIADSGELISEEIKDKIFDPFVCGDKARNPEKHNSGLGLSITKKIVEMHNGRLYLEQEWKGYTKAFIIELP